MVCSPASLSGSAYQVPLGCRQWGCFPSWAQKFSHAVCKAVPLHVTKGRAAPYHFINADRTTPLYVDLRTSYFVYHNCAMRTWDCEKFLQQTADARPSLGVCSDTRGGPNHRRPRSGQKPSWEPLPSQSALYAIGLECNPRLWNYIGIQSFSLVHAMTIDESFSASAREN